MLGPPSRRRFASEDAARAFDEALAEVSPAARRADTARHGRSGGVYSYSHRRGRSAGASSYRRSDGTQTTKRGFTSERAAREPPAPDRAGRARRGAPHEGDLRRLLGAVARAAPAVPGARHLDRATRSHGRKRLLPAFGERPLGELSVDEIREFVAELAEAVEAGELAAKTVNNTLGTLVVCLNAAVEDGLLAANPALRVQRLPPAHIEREYLRLHEIPRYLDACSDVYRRWPSC